MINFKHKVNLRPIQLDLTEIKGDTPLASFDEKQTTNSTPKSFKNMSMKNSKFSK